jgi:hypothetical protein
MALPNLTPEQCQAALVKAAQARRDGDRSDPGEIIYPSAR